jgi:hypothetical protein
VTELRAGVAASSRADDGRDVERGALLDDLVEEPAVVDLPDFWPSEALRAGRRRDDDGPLADARPAGPRLVVGMPPMVA